MVASIREEHLDLALLLVFSSKGYKAIDARRDIRLGKRLLLVDVLLWIMNRHWYLNFLFNLSNLGLGLMHMTIYLLVRLHLRLLLIYVAFKLQLECLPVEMFFNVGTE